MSKIPNPDYFLDASDTALYNTTSVFPDNYTISDKDTYIPTSWKINRTDYVNASNGHHILHTLKSGYYIGYYKEYSSGYYSIEWGIFTSNNAAYMTGYLTSSRTDRWVYFDFALFEDTGTITFLLNSTSYTYLFLVNTVTNREKYDTAFAGSAPIVYQWQPWVSLRGNSGQYGANLTTIKSTSIGDITAANYGSASDFNYISSQVDIVPILRNLNYNSPVKIAWAGVNWLTVELQSDSGLLTNQVKAVFKIYIKNVSDTTPVYTDTKLIFIGSANVYYLSFVFDDTQEAGVFLPVGYDTVAHQYYWGNETISQSEMNLVWLWLHSSDAGTPDESPYSHGTTDNGGSGGNDIPQDDIHNVNVPALGGMASGMFTVYCPTDVQLGQISAFLWSDSFIDNVKKYFNNASDNIIAFYVLPLKPGNLPTKNFKIGNLENTNITQVEYLSNRFTSVEMGSLYIDKRWETYLDFSPFTKFNLYLPGIGVVALETSDLMYPTNPDGSSPVQLGSTISLEYVIDLMTGVLVAYVKINGQVRYQFPGKVGYSIPLTGQNYTAMGTGFVTAMAGLAATIASGGTAAPFTAGAAAAGIVNAMKPEVYRSGNLSGDASMLSLKTPMLIRTIPNKPALEDQPKFTGAPSYKIGTLSSFSGFTQVEIVHLEGFSCTDTERAEIESLLKAGVIL